MELDPDLVERARQGNREAFQELVRQFWSPVFLFVRGKVRDQERARDLTQDTFMQAYEKLAGLRSNQSLPAWLFTIASHKVIDHYRRQGANPVAASTDAEGYDPPSAEPAVESRLDAAEQEEQVQAALARIGDRYRTVLILRYWSGFTPAQVARLLGEPEGTIRNRIFRGHQHLRNELENQPGREPATRPGEKKAR